MPRSVSQVYTQPIIHHSMTACSAVQCSTAPPAGTQKSRGVRRSTEQLLQGDSFCVTQTSHHILFSSPCILILPARRVFSFSKRLMRSDPVARALRGFVICQVSQKCIRSKKPLLLCIRLETSSEIRQIFKYSLQNATIYHHNHSDSKT